MAANAQFIPDGDPAFIRVDTRRPAHELEPGVAADALNKRFEDGRAWPRHSVNLQPWGILGGGNLLAGQIYLTTVYPQWSVSTVTVVRGHRYFIKSGNQTLITSGRDHVYIPPTKDIPNSDVVSPGFYTATTDELNFWISPSSNVAVTAQLFRVESPKAFSRFNDPNGTDTLVLCTDDIRDAAGEDGGRGRAWRLASGNNAQVISLNGHDVWDTSRLVPCLNGLVLLRQGDERHYFAAAAVDNTNSQISLNCVPNWSSGDQVEFVTDDQWSNITGPSGATPPQTLTDYFVKNVTGSVTGQVVELYTDPGLSTKLAWAGGSATGRFYLKRKAANPGPYGNGAPPLIMQPGLNGQTAFEAGFLAVPVNIAATAFDGTTKILTVNNHRLVPGDQVSYLHVGGTTETFYAAVRSSSTIRLHASVINALADSLSTAQTPSPGQAAGDFIKKAGASGLPMPPGREGCYLPSGKLIIANQQNNLPISDPLDPLHFAPVSQTLTANLGESDAITSIEQLGDDVVGKDITVIGKTNVLLRLMGLSGPSSGWSLKEITREYGFIAPLAVFRAGADVWGLSRRGVVSVLQTMATLLADPAAPAPPPVSYDLKKYIDQIDWPYADQACAETWNNRAFIAVPLKGQTFTRGSRPRNNGILVYNFLNRGWEGIWTGEETLHVYDFARHYVYGEERLCWVNYYGQVCWFGDAFTDQGPGGSLVAIEDSLTTRTYCKGNQEPKLWLRGRVLWDTQSPSLSCVASSPGVNERQQVLGPGQTYDNTKYSTYGTADYSPTGGDFNAPDREDYSLTPEELLDGELDVHQNWSETFRMRINDWGVQVEVANASGSCKLQSVMVEFVPGLRTASRKT